MNDLCKLNPYGDYGYGDGAGHGDGYGDGDGSGMARVGALIF